MITTSFVSAAFLAQAAPVPDNGLQIQNTVVMMVGFFVLMYVLMIRPQRKKEKELRDRISSLKTGDRVVTIGGVHGIVSNVTDGPTLVLKVDDNCKMKVDKSAVSLVLAKDSE